MIGDSVSELHHACSVPLLTLYPFDTLILLVTRRRSMNICVSMRVKTQVKIMPCLEKRLIL